MCFQLYYYIIFMHIHSTIGLANSMSSLHRNKSCNLVNITVEDEKKSDYESQQQQQVWSDERIVKGMKKNNNNNLHYYHCIASLHGGEGNLYSIAISSKGLVSTASHVGDICRIRAWKQPDCMDPSHFPPPDSTPLLLLETCCSRHAVVLSTYRDAPTFLYSGSSDGVINFWEKEKVSFRYNHGGFLQGHRFGVLCLTVVERLLLSGSEDTTVRIWRREERGWSHECLVVLDGHREPVKCLAGTLETMENRVMNKMETRVLVYSGSSDKTFKVWRVKVFLNHNDQDKKGLMEYEEKEAEEEDGDLKMKKLYETSPVLSPWVQKKLQPNYF